MTIYINGVDAETVGLLTLSYPPIAMPNKRTRSYIIPGRSGALKRWNGDYDEIDKNVKFALLTGDVQAAKVFIANALTITFGNEPDYVYDCKVVKEFQMKQNKAGDYEINVVFVCNPLKKLVSELTYTGASIVLANTTNTDAYPKFTLTAPASFGLTVGAKTWTIQAPTGTLIIDGTLMLVYDGGGNAWAKLSDYELPMIPAGGTVTITSTAATIVVNPQWRWF